MNHREKLKNIYNSSFFIKNINHLPQKYIDYALLIGNQSSNHKGVYTVLITLLVHKSLFPEQDIRRHQSSMEGGFSGRTIDFQFITPTLKELELPSMAESGWLTRSLEQPYPYNLDYSGKISNQEVKTAFLNVIDYAQNHHECVDDLLHLILYAAIQARAKNIVEITKPSEFIDLNIQNIIFCLKEHFSTKYRTRGGSKLPVLAVYALYQSLVEEVKRYENYTLGVLGSHTSSDLKSRSSGDIEVFDAQGKVFEVVEIKHNKEIDLQILRVTYDKIKRFNPSRYYVLSSKEIISSQLSEIDKFIHDIWQENGCQVIVNGIIPTIKYYLRLIDLEKFIHNYSNLIAEDRELKNIHKMKWNELIKSL
jgi:DNA (cytosine-5)-methyltransferase 1